LISIVLLWIPCPKQSP